MIRTMVLAASFLSPAAAWGAQLAISGVGADKQVTATLTARRVDGPPASFEQPIALPGTAAVSLPAGLWEVRLAGEGLWAPPAYLRDSDAAAIEVWPTVALTGTSSEIKALRVRFTPHDPDGASGETECTIDGQSWSCWIPAGRYDLRFASSTFAPEFRFGVTVPAADLRLRFVPGASLSGRVEAARGAKMALDGVELALTPPGSENTAAKARSDQKGFFQFKGLAPGDYSIHATKKGLTARSEAIKILPGVAAELSAPLVLDTPKQLSIVVMPRLDPAGRPWRVQLSSHDERLRRADIVSESQVSPEGEWSHPRLVAGRYSITVLSGSGGRWTSQDVIIDHDDVNLAIAALAQKVVGSIKVGDRPLQASLFFGGEWGLKIQSDAEGHFEGEIPLHANEDHLVLIEAETPRVKRTIRRMLEKSETGELRLDIALPATALTGRVLNRDRSPEPHTIITVAGDKPITFEQVFNEPDGSFQLQGYEPGRYRVNANAYQRSSKFAAVELESGETAEVELILDGEERLQGRLTIGEAPAIAGEVYAFPRDSWSPTLPSARTDESGQFAMDLPAGTKLFDFLAVHPACDIIFARTTLVADKSLGIRMQQFGGTVTIESSAKDLFLIRGGAEMSVTWLAEKAGGSVAPGRITIPRLVPSQYSVCTLKKTKCASGYLPPHGTLTLALAE